MKKSILLTLFLWISISEWVNAQCSINIGIVQPIACVGGQVCVPIEINPIGCVALSDLRIELSQPCQPTNFSPASKTDPVTSFFPCIQIPINFQACNYGIRVTSTGGLTSVVKILTIDTLDFSPAPKLNIQILPPIRPSYCPDDTIKFKITNVTNAPPGYTIQWSKNDSARVGATDSIFSFTGIVDGDFIFASVTKGNKCAENATGYSDTLKIKVNKKPKIKVQLFAPSTGCEKTLNNFVAKLDSAGPDPLIIWTRVRTGGIIDTLSQGINDTLFTLSPSDSAKFGNQICAEVIAGRCKLKAKDCYTIRACGQVFIDPPLDATVCAGSIFNIPYTIVGTFLPANVFSAQLSDQDGSFSNPTNIGTLTSDRADTIRALIPANLSGADCYRIRIISTLPRDTSDTSACIKVFSKPQAPTTTGDSVCKSGNVTLTANSILPGAVFEWFSSPSGGNPVFTGASQTIFISRDTVFYIATRSIDGCLSNRTIVRGIVNPLPPVDAGADRRLCIGSQVITLSPFPVNGIWSGDLPVLNNTVDVSGIVAGTFKLIYSNTNEKGCSNHDTLILTIVPRPAVNAGPDQEFCQNVPPVLLVGTPTGGTWTGPGVQTDGTFVPSVAGPGSYSLIYTKTEEGCSASDTILVIVKPAPSDFTVVTTDPTACGAADGTATITGITTGSGFKVRWSVETADSLADPTISTLPAGSYTVRITNLATGCRRTKAFGLSDPSATPPVINGLAANYCSSDEPVTMTATPATPVGVFVGTGVVGNQFFPAQADLGLNIVSYSYDAGGGCIGTASVTVRVNPSPVVNAGGPADTICSNNPSFTLEGYSPNTPPASWSPQPLVSPTGLVTPSFANVGNNILTLSRTVGSCTTTDTRVLFVFPQPVPTITRNPSATLCLGNPVILTANLNSGVVATRYEWFRDNALIPNENGSTYTATVPGSYTVKVTGLGECPGTSAPVQIDFNLLPSVNVSPSGILTPCSNQPVSLIADSLQGYTYQWFGLDSIPGATTRTFIPQLSGQYRVKIKNSNGCLGLSNIIDVTIKDAPLAPIISPPFADTCLQPGQPITVIIGASGSGLSFEWYRISNPDVLLSGSDPSRVFSLPGQYYAIVKSSNGCQTRSATINIKQTINISITDTIIERCQGEAAFVVPGLNPGGCQLLNSDGSVLAGNIFNPVNAGSFVLTYQCTNSNGCISRKNITVVVRPKPIAVLSTQGPANVCQGDTVILLANDGIAVGCVYQLLRNGVTFGNPGISPVIPVTTEGDYSVRITCFGCATTSNVIQVRFKKKPNATAGPDISGCSPVVQNLNITGISTPGTWSGSIRVTTDGAYNSGAFIGCDTVTLRVDSAGCFSTSTKQICVDSLPNLSIDIKNATACAIANGKAWVVNGNGSYSYEWTKVGETSILSTTDSLSGVLPGAYQVKITGSGNSCSIIRPAIITSPNNLTVNILALPDSVCSNAAPVPLSGSPDGGVFISFGGRVTPPGVFNPSFPGPSVDTVYYTVDINGCVGSSKKAIKINEIPIVDAGPDLEVCLGDTIILRAIQPSNIPLIWVGNQVSDDSLYIANDPGITSSLVVVGYSQNGCSNTDSKLVKVNLLPDFTVSPTDVTTCGICNGSATRNVLNPGNFQTVWRNLTSGSQLGGGASIQNLCVGTYSVKLTNNTTGCNKTQTFGITGPTNINPFVCLGNVPVTICQNAAPVTITKCSPSASVVIGTFNTETLNPSVFLPGNINVLLTDTDANGCIGVEQKIVEIKEAPIVNISGVAPLTACSGLQNIQLTNFFPAFDAGVPENGWTAIGAPAGFTITRDGRINTENVTVDATFQLVYSNKTSGPNGCLESKTMSFSVFKTPTAAILPNSATIEICTGTTTTFTSQFTAPGYGYTWFLGNQSNPPVIGFGSQLIASLPGVYRLKVDNNGCSSDFSGVISLTTRPAPVIVNIGSDTSICQSVPFVNLTNPTIQGVFTSKFWSVVSPTPPAFLNDPIILPGNGSIGINTVRFIVSNGVCSDTAFRNYFIVPNINSTISVIGNQLEICSGDTATLVADSVGLGYSYEWSKEGTGIIIGQTSQTLKVTETGTYRVKVLINGNSECATFSTAAVTINVNPSPVVTISGNPVLEICYPAGPIDLNSVRPFTPLDATWTGPNNIVSANGVITPNNIPSEGSYTLTLTKTIGSCTDFKTLTISAKRTPDPAFTASAQAICEGEIVVLKYNNPSQYNLSWKFGNAIVGTTDSISLSAAGSYTLVVSNGICKDSSSSSFEVKPKPVFDLPADSEICKNGNTIQFLPSNPSPGLGEWTGPGISPSGLLNPTAPDVTPSGPIALRYTLTSEFGCVTSKVVNILVNPIPQITLSTDKDTIEVFGPAKLNATGGVLFEWSPSGTLNVATGPQVLAASSETTTYTVRVTTDKGCVGEASKEIIVDQEFKIYDGFSPNNDQVNDAWIIKNIQRYPNSTVKVFNRWGNLVYESEKGYPRPWDGKFEGNPVPPGAYYYIVDFGDSALTPKSGSITLVR
jgi:gliding motility-associated-like protein